MVLNSEDNQTQIISESENSNISLEELANTTGTQNGNSIPSDAEILLGLSEENQHPVRHESPPDITKNPVLKTLFQAGLIGVAVLLGYFMWMMFGSTEKSPDPIALTPEEVENEQAQKIQELQEQLYRERAEVAVRNLQSPLPNEGKKKRPTTQPSPQRSTQQPTSPPTKSPPPRPVPTTTTRPSPPPPSPSPPARVAPPPPRPVPTTATRPSPPLPPIIQAPPPPLTQSEEEFDDLSLWSELAALGQVQQTNLPSQNHQISQSELAALGQVQQTNFQPKNHQISQTEQTPSQTEEVDTFENSSSHIASVVVGNEPIPKPQNVSQAGDNLTPGMQGILNQTSEYANPNYQEVQVAIGTTAEGKVVIPLHWNQEIDGTDGMFLVELTEPLIASDGTSALEKGTQLIVSVSFISDAGQVFQSVMAVVHPDGRQETIPITEEGYNGAAITPLILRGKRGEVLIAEKIKGSDASPGLGSDIAVGLMAGISEAADNITQPSQQVQTQTTGLSSTTTAQQNRQEPEAAFIKGLTETLTERMTTRLDAEPEELKIFQVERGEKVLLFVNGFVTFRVPTGRN
ncbi:MAG: hypothetical protein WBA77_00470 [Microcoleaceae cyanobacterium]